MRNGGTQLSILDSYIPLVFFSFSVRLSVSLSDLLKSYPTIAPPLTASWMQVANGSTSTHVFPLFYIMQVACFGRHGVKQHILPPSFFFLFVETGHGGFGGVVWGTRCTFLGDYGIALYVCACLATFICDSVQREGQFAYLLDRHVSQTRVCTAVYHNLPSLFFTVSRELPSVVDPEKRKSLPW